MKVLTRVTVALIVTWLAACSSYPTPLKSDPNADATLVIRENQVMRMATGGSGQGTLMLNGWEYSFEVSNMVLSGVGPGAIELEGDVYNIDEASDIEGTYNLVEAQVQAGAGAQGFWFENEKGVRAHIRANGQDVTVRLKGGGSIVTLK